MASRSRNSTAARGPRPLTGTRLLEALIGGWRPLARLDVEGFALLRSRCITRRANSAVALEVPADRGALGQAVSRVAALMRSAGAAPTFRPLRDHGPAAGADALLGGRAHRPPAPGARTRGRAGYRLGGPRRQRRRPQPGPGPGAGAGPPARPASTGRDPHRRAGRGLVRRCLETGTP